MVEILIPAGGWLYWFIAAGFFVATVVTFFANVKSRRALGETLEREGRKSIGIFALSRGDVSKTLDGCNLVAPEKLWTYDEEYVERFVRATAYAQASGRIESPLVLYVTFSLRRWDLWFAIALMICTAMIDFGWSCALLVAHPTASRIVLLAACMGILYGVSDIAEDLKLAGILDDPGQIDAGEVAAANFLTRMKLVTLVLSGAGVAIFGILSGVAIVISNLPGTGLPSLLNWIRSFGKNPDGGVGREAGGEGIPGPAI
jgi:hypothetical protein